MLTVIEGGTGAAADRTYQAGTLAEGKTIVSIRRAVTRGGRMFPVADLSHPLEA